MPRFELPSKAFETWETRFGFTGAIELGVYVEPRVDDYQDVKRRGGITEAFEPHCESRIHQMAESPVAGSRCSPLCCHYIQDSV